MKRKVAVGVVGIIAMIMAVSLAVSAETTLNIKSPVLWLAYIPCSGDLILLEGRMHIQMRWTEDGNGGVHGGIKFQPQNLQGQVITVGPNLGLRYNGNGVTQESFNFKKGTTFTRINRYLMVGQGPNFMVRETWHITINARGKVTAVVDKREVSCK